MDIPLASDATEIVWEPCGSCWGQRVIYTPSPGTGALTRESCGACVGLGQRAVLVPARARLGLRR